MFLNSVFGSLIAIIIIVCSAFISLYISNFKSKSTFIFYLSLSLLTCELAVLVQFNWDHPTGALLIFAFHDDFLQF